MTPWTGPSRMSRHRVTMVALFGSIYPVQIAIGILHPRRKRLRRIVYCLGMDIIVRVCVCVRVCTHVLCTLATATWHDLCPSQMRTLQKSVQTWPVPIIANVRHRHPQFFCEPLADQSYYLTIIHSSSIPFHPIPSHSIHHSNMNAGL